MNNRFLYSLGWLRLLWAFPSSCGHQETVLPVCDCCQPAYVIGFDQCTATSVTEKSMGRDLVLAFPKMGDTLITYNLPDSLYQFPDELFKSHWFNFLFAQTEQKKYSVFVSYHLVKPEDKTFVA